MSCDYLINNENKIFSYQDLIEAYESGIRNASDIVYAKTQYEIEQDNIYDKIMSLQKDGFVESQVSYVDGEPYISDNESIPCQKFIDDPVLFVYDNKQLLPKMNFQNYKEDLKTTLREDGKTPEEAEYIANQEVLNWETIGKDAADLHTLLSRFNFQEGLTKFQALLVGTKFQNVSGMLFSTMSEFREKFLGEIKRKCGNISSRIVYNLNLKSKIENIDKDLFGHIDMIVIDGYGDLHIVNYKITTSTIKEGTVKLEKYKYQMALLRQMLASHGLKVRNATLNIVPIRVDYDQDYKNITKAIVKDPLELTMGIGKYKFAKYDTVAKHFIKSSLNVNQATSKDLTEAEEELQRIFPEVDFDIYGIRMTAQEWIKKNRGLIHDSNNPDYSYEIYFGGGDVAKIPKEYREKPENNEYIIKEILKRQELLNTNSDIVLNRLIKDIKAGLKDGGYAFYGKNNVFYAKSGAYINTVLRDYFATGDISSDWEFIDNDLLNSSGIILLKNTKTNQLDVIALSPNDITISRKLRRGDTIIGSYSTNDQSGNLYKYKATYGNIETVKAFVLLNKVLPKITGDFVLGKMRILSLHGRGQGLSFNIEHFNKDCFSTILKKVNHLLPETNIENNFTKCKFVNKFETLVQDYEAIVKDGTTLSEKQELIDIGFGNLADANTIEAKLTALRQIEQAMRETYKGLNTKRIQDARGIVDKKVLTLYKDVINAITYYSVGEVFPIEKRLSWISEHFYVSDLVPKENYQLIVNLYTKAINSIAEQTSKIYTPIRNVFFDFYDKIGYSRVQNSTMGGQAKQFDDLYKKDKNGNKLLRLLNPYDNNDIAQIQSHRDIKQKFLKKILFEFAKIRYPMNGIEFNFTDENDPALLKFIEDHSDTYFNIPLEKASISTRRQKYSIQKKLNYILDKCKELWKNPERGLQEFVYEVLDEDEQDLMNQGIEAMQLSNKFITGEGNGRENYIAQKGIDYFETNLENLIIDFVERDVETKEFNKALIVIKGVLFQLDIMGHDPNQKEAVEQTIKMIEDFVNINIFNTSIMDKKSQKIMGFLAPLRKMVGNTLIAGNLISGIRDTFEGAMQNTIRAITKYQTDIDAASLAKAYEIVVKNSFTDGRSINIVNQLCLIYRLSNIDVSRISEGFKSERGITNIGNWMYATLRRPDFLNRMTLFVAKCCKDGVYEAFDIKDGQLVYDWKKDKRFKIYASGNKNHPDYYKQMGAYYNAVRDYNKDHPENAIDYSDDLPMPYSFQEVEVIKGVARSIYGSYDKSTRSKFDHIAIGTFWGMFTTWMNGLYANYTLKPGQYGTKEFKLEQSTDEQGNFRFFDENHNIIIKVENGNDIKYYYEGTTQEVTEGLNNIQPVMDKIPIVVQGIWYTLVQASKSLLNRSFNEDIWKDPVNRKNIIKLGSDLLMLLFYFILYSCVLDPAYKEFKKDSKRRDFLTNVAIDVLYKSSSRSFDGFKGMFNVIDFVGNNTNPPIYTQNIKLVKEGLQVATGNKNVMDYLTGNVAIFKAYQFAVKSARD